LRRSKIEYLKCGRGCAEATIGEMVIPRAEKSKYLGSIIEEKGDIDEGINNHIKMG